MISIFKKYNQILVGILFLFYFLYTLSNSLDINDNVMYATLLILIIYFQTVFEFLYFYNKNGKPRLQDWMRLAIFFMLVLNFMKIVNSSNGLAEVAFVVGKLSLNSSPFAMIIIIFALISLDFAYILNNSLKKENYEFKDTFFINRKYLVFNLLIITTIFQAYLLFSGITGFGNTQTEVSGGSSFVSMLSSYLTPFALILAAYIIFIENNSNKRYLVIFYASLIIQILTGFLSGMKENALEPILYITIVFLIAGRKIPRKVLLIGFIIVAFLYPINNSYRNVVSNPYLNTGSSILNMSIAIKIISKQPILETLLGGAESYGDRSSMFPFLIYAINTEEKWDYYKNMSRYLYLPIGWFMPRALLEDKPKADIGGVLYAQVTGERTATSITVTNIGWAYLEGGILFIFITFIIIGLILELVDKMNYKKPIVLLFYITLFQLSIKPEWDAYFMISSLIPMLIIYTMILKIIGLQRISQ